MKWQWKQFHSYFTYNYSPLNSDHALWTYGVILWIANAIWWVWIIATCSFPQESENLFLFLSPWMRTDSCSRCCYATPSFSIFEKSINLFWQSSLELLLHMLRLICMSDKSGWLYELPVMCVTPPKLIFTLYRNAHSLGTVDENRLAKWQFWAEVVGRGFVLCLTWSKAINLYQSSYRLAP